MAIEIGINIHPDIAVDKAYLMIRRAIHDRQNNSVVMELCWYRTTEDRQKHKEASAEFYRLRPILEAGMPDNIKMPANPTPEQVRDLTEKQAAWRNDVETKCIVSRQTMMSVFLVTPLQVPSTVEVSPNEGAELLDINGNLDYAKCYEWLAKNGHEGKHV